MRLSSLDALRADLNRAAAVGRAPLRGAVDVTWQCPLACRFCYGQPVTATEPPLSLAEYERLFDELAAAGCLYLIFSGGEPFARADFAELWQMAADRGFFTKVYTNATLITPALAQRLAAANPASFEVSIYGATPAAYDAFTQRPGSYERCRRGLDALHAAGLRVDLKAVCVADTIGDLPAMRRLAERYGWPLVAKPGVIAALDGSVRPLASRLSVVDEVTLSLGDGEERARYQELGAHWHRASRDDGQFVCGAGQTGFAVDPQGRLSVCYAHRHASYDWRRGTFAEGWHGLLKDQREARLAAESRCRGCGARGVCGSCPAHNHWENGAADQPVEHFCQATHVGLLALGLRLPEHGPCPYCVGGERHQQVIEQAQQVRARLDQSEGMSGD